MKEETFSHPSNDADFETDAFKLVSSLQTFGIESFYFEANFDLLNYAMTELVASETFVKLPIERKKELFNQYATLRSVLELLQSFVSRHPVSNKADQFAFSNQ